MAAGTPLTSLTLGATSIADDLGYVALTDLARALGSVTEDLPATGHVSLKVGVRKTARHLRGASTSRITLPVMVQVRLLRSVCGSDYSGEGVHEGHRRSEVTNLGVNVRFCLICR